MKLPNSIQNLIAVFEQLPGIGPKTAARLTFYLWQTPNHFVERFAQSLLDLKQKTKQCSICFNLDETDPCSICADSQRDQTLICVVERPLDIIAFERMGDYRGVYHVLGGVINPLEHIGPDELRIQELLDRITKFDNSSHQARVREVILATNPTMEGEATASYIAKKIKELEARIQNPKPIKITRLGQGLPTGADLDYADIWTLKQAWENRRQL